MALPTTKSRFALLTDDAADPFEKKKKKASTNTSGSTTAGNAKNKKSSGVVGTAKPKPGTGTANKNAASGSQQGQGKKKKTGTPTINGSGSGDSNKNVPTPEDFPRLLSESDRLRGMSESSAAEGDIEGREGSKKKSKKGKKPIASEESKDEQWDIWQKRDQEFVTGSFESDLETALIQSKLECQKDETKTGTKSRKNKNKPASVSLSEFNQMIGCGNGNGLPGLVEPNWPKNLSGFAAIVPPPGLVPTSGLEGDQDDALMEQFRKETQIEIERERRLEIERAILRARPPIPIPQAKGKKPATQKSFDSAKENVQNKNAIPCANPEHLAQANLLQEKDQTITQLTAIKTELESKYEDLGTKFKKVCSMLADSQLKDKVKLLRDNEKLTQLNTDLNEQLTLLHSQLEQEKSKCSTLSADLRKLEYSRKRTQSHSELNN